MKKFKTRITFTQTVIRYYDRETMQEAKYAAHEAADTIAEQKVSSFVDIEEVPGYFDEDGFFHNFENKK